MNGAAHIYTAGAAAQAEAQTVHAAATAAEANAANVATA